MIQKLDHTDHTIASEIRRVFQVSYVVEAELLGAEDFPPLKRAVEDFLSSDTQFFGYFSEGELAAVMEIRTFTDSTLIQSLVVDPKFFRRGIGGEMVQFALENFPSEVFNVETGAANGPAVKLYEKFGFRIIKEYLTKEGIRKVRFEK